MKLVHYVQIGLACLAATASAFAQNVPQYSPQAMIIAGGCLSLLTGLGIVSPSAFTPKKGTP